MKEKVGSPRYLNPKCKRKSWDTTETHFSVATNQEHMNSLPGWLQNYLGPSKHCGSIRPRVSQLVPCWFPVPCVNTFLFWPHVSIVCYIWHTGSQLTHAAHVFEFWFSSWPWFRLRCYGHPLWEHNGWKARCFSRNWYTLKRRSRRVLLNAVSNSSHIPTNTEQLVAMYSRWRMSSFFRSLIPRESEFFFWASRNPQFSSGKQIRPPKENRQLQRKSLKRNIVRDASWRTRRSLCLKHDQRWICKNQGSKAQTRFSVNQGRRYARTWKRSHNHLVSRVPWSWVIWWQNRNMRRRLHTFSSPEDEHVRSAVFLRFPCEHYHMVMFYLGQSYLGQFLLRPVLLGQVLLRPILLRPGLLRPSAT